jgi:hypothetical protein
LQRQKRPTKKATNTIYITDINVQRLCSISSHRVRNATRLTQTLNLFREETFVVSHVLGSNWSFTKRIRSPRRVEDRHVPGKATHSRTRLFVRRLGFTWVLRLGFRPTSNYYSCITNITSENFGPLYESCARVRQPSSISAQNICMFHSCDLTHSRASYSLILGRSNNAITSKELAEKCLPLRITNCTMFLQIRYSVL